VDQLVVAAVPPNEKKAELDFLFVCVGGHLAWGPLPLDHHPDYRIMEMGPRLKSTFLQ